MNLTIYERLKQAAIDQKLLTYSELAAAIGLTLTGDVALKALGTMLDEPAGRVGEGAEPFPRGEVWRRDRRRPRVEGDLGARLGGEPMIGAAKNWTCR
jgi:hypothetical protein